MYRMNDWLYVFVCVWVRVSVDGQDRRTQTVKVVSMRSVGSNLLYCVLVVISPKT
jgi:hypothetical protein